METPCCQKKFEFQKNTRHKISVPLAIRTNLPRKKFQTSKKCRKNELSIDKTNDCVMNSERGALVRGSIPPSGHSVHNTAGDMWRTPARRLIQRYLFKDV